MTTVFFVHEVLLVPLYYWQMTVVFGHEVLLVPRLTSPCNCRETSRITCKATNQDIQRVTTVPLNISFSFLLVRIQGLEKKVN